MVEKRLLFITLVVVSTLNGCSSVNESQSESQRLLFRDLKRSCVETNGGARMDAVGLYGGRLSIACARWAHRRTREVALYPPWIRDDGGVAKTSAEGQSRRKP